MAGAAEQFLAALAGHGFTYRQQGRGWRAQCPCHQGHDRNLAINESSDGKLLLSCKSHHCSFGEIMGAVGLKPEDTPNKPYQKANGIRRGPPDAEYPYRDEQGRVLYYIGRYPGKEFVSYKRDAMGVPVWQLGETRRVLFGLPELLRSKPGDLIAIVEGEKDAINVAAMGITATSNPHGAEHWRQEYTEWLKQHLPERRFAIVEDCDPVNSKTGKRPGEEHGKKVFASLTEAGLTAHRVRLPGLAEGQDVSDWIVGKTEEDLHEALQPPVPAHIKTLDESVILGDELNTRVFPVPEQLVPHVVLRGFSTLLAGDSKLGKSSLLLRMMLAMASGGWWLDRDCRPENRLPQSRVLFINFEDPPFLTQDRAKRIMYPEPIPEGFIIIPPPYGLSFAQVLEWLAHARVKFELDAVVLDPIAIAAEWEDEADNAKVALTFKSLQRCAYETQLAILSSHHVTKRPGEYGSNIRGASAIKANVLGFHVIERDGDLFHLSGINKATGTWDVMLGRGDETDYRWWIEESRRGNTRTPQQAAKEEAKATLWGCIRDQPGVTTERLAELLNLQRRTIANYLAELEESKVVVKAELPRGDGERGGVRFIWFLAPV